jgi:hypothetical protein
VRGRQDDPGDILELGGVGRERDERVPPVGVLPGPTVLKVPRAARVLHLPHLQDVLTVHDVVEAESLKLNGEVGDVPQGAYVGRDEAWQLDAE